MNASGQRQASFIISSLLFFLSALCQVTAMALLPFYIAYDYSLKKGMFAQEVKDGSAGRNLLRRYLPLLIAASAKIPALCSEPRKKLRKRLDVIKK
jgi:hypothetical protein